MILYKNNFKALQLYFRNVNFNLNSEKNYSGTKDFLKGSRFFCCRSLSNQLIIKKHDTFGLEHHLKKAFYAQKLEKGFAATSFLRDDALKRLPKKREKKRSSLILPKHIGRVFFVHNGKTFSSIQIYRKMLGHKFGEFASTRKKPVHKKKK